MTEMTPPVDPFSQPPTAAPVASEGDSASSKKTPWKAIIGVVAVIAVVVVGVVLLTGDDDKGDSANRPAGNGDAAPGEWHLMRFADDSIVELAADGTVGRSIALPAGFSPTLSATTGRWLPGEPDGTSLPVVDLSDGEARTIALPADGFSADRGTLRQGASSAVYFSTAAYSLVLVDFQSASAVAIGSGGRYVRGPDKSGHSTYFSFGPEPATLIVPQDNPAGWWEVPGGVADVRGTDALAVITADFASTVQRLNGTEQEGQSVEFKAAVVGGMLTEDGALVIDTGGGVWSVNFADGTRESLGTLGIGVDAAVPIGNDQLFAWGGTGSVLVGPDGQPGRVIDPVPDGNGGTLPVLLLSGGAGSKCIALQPGGEPHPQDARASLWDVESRTQLAKFEGTPQAVSADGCTVVSMARPVELVVDGQVVDLGLETVQVVSPDHSHVVGARKGNDGPSFVLMAVADGTEVLLEPGAHFYARF